MTTNDEVEGSPDESGGGPLLTAPSERETRRIADGVISALGGPGNLSDLQHLLTGAVFHAMTSHTIDTTSSTTVTPAQFASVLSRRTPAFRERIVQIMLLVGMSAHPMDRTTVQAIREFAGALEVREEMIEIAVRFADGALDLANIDFARNGYLAEVTPERLAAVHTSDLHEAWGHVEDDPQLTGRWASLEELPVGTLGRGVADFYRDRGFIYPGRPGSAPPLLAQHDWAHVLADYGTSVESEIEVFAFMARANDDPRAFSLLAMVVSLFETGYLAAGAGLFEADPGHLTRSGMSVRLADAMRRGAMTQGSHDFLTVDWFDLADRPVAVVRREMGLTVKSANATEAGSAGPWQSGGITVYQLNAAREAARSAGADHVPWHPDPTRHEP